eukprot:4157176-Prorocentrum_lima.AAC.1
MHQLPCSTNVGDQGNIALGLTRLLSTNQGNIALGLTRLRSTNQGNIALGLTRLRSMRTRARSVSIPRDKAGHANNAGAPNRACVASNFLALDTAPPMVAKNVAKHQKMAANVLQAPPSTAENGRKASVTTANHEKRQK